jgi:hypothetical protein
MEEAIEFDFKEIRPLTDKVFWVGKSAYIPSEDNEDKSTVYVGPFSVFNVTTCVMSLYVNPLITPFCGKELRSIETVPPVVLVNTNVSPDKLPPLIPTLVTPDVIYSFKSFKNTLDVVNVSLFTIGKKSTDVISPENIIGNVEIFILFNLFLQYYQYYFFLFELYVIYNQR